jgi:hypothetical protein
MLLPALFLIADTLARSLGGLPAGVTDGWAATIRGEAFGYQPVTPLAFGMPPQTPGDRIGAQWRRFSSLPGGRWLFSRLVRFAVPYTATIGANIQELRPGSDRR